MISRGRKHQYLESPQFLQLTISGKNPYFAPFVEASLGTVILVLCNCLVSSKFVVNILAEESISFISSPSENS